MSDSSLTRSTLLALPESSIIWTDHALARLRQRHLRQSDVTQVLHQPAKIYPGRKPGTFKVIGQVETRRLHVILAPAQKDQWLVVSVWVRGEEDQVFWLERVLNRLVEAVLQRLWPR